MEMYINICLEFDLKFFYVKNVVMIKKVFNNEKFVEIVVKVLLIFLVVFLLQFMVMMVIFVLRIFYQF